MFAESTTTHFCKTLLKKNKKQSVWSRSWLLHPWWAVGMVTYVMYVTCNGKRAKIQIYETCIQIMLFSSPVLVRFSQIIQTHFLLSIYIHTFLCWHHSLQVLKSKKNKTKPLLILSGVRENCPQLCSLSQMSLGFGASLVMAYLKANLMLLHYKRQQKSNKGKRSDNYWIWSTFPFVKHM